MFLISSMVLKVEGKKASNQINMGPLLKEITTIEKRDN